LLVSDGKRLVLATHSSLLFAGCRAGRRSETGRVPAAGTEVTWNVQSCCAWKPTALTFLGNSGLVNTGSKGIEQVYMRQNSSKQHSALPNDVSVK
jgi:hypothetical protein